MAKNAIVYDEPILVFGRPRSGTTWVGKIFDSHPDTLYLHEPDTAVLLREIPIIVEPNEVALDDEYIRSILMKTMNIRQTRVSASLPQFSKAYRSPPFSWMHQNICVAAKVWSRVFGELRIPDLVSRSAPRPVRPVWKSIESVGRIRLISRVFPCARIIHILRHPGGQISSVREGQNKRYFDDNNEDFGILKILSESSPARRRGIDMKAFQSMSYIERSAWSWVIYNESAIDVAGCGDNILLLKYEDICASPTNISKKMFDFAKLNWSDQTERFISKSTSGADGRFYSVFRDPYKAASKWRDLLTTGEISAVEKIVKDSAFASMFL